MEAGGDGVVENFWGDMPEEEFYASQGIRHRKHYFTTPHGTVFGQEFLPVDSGRVKGVVCMTHGYGSDTGWVFQIIALEVAKWGYAAYAADMLGHGRSEGVRCYTPDCEKVAAASLMFFKAMRDANEPGLAAFLFGESMGGAVSFLMHFQDPDGWDGFIFSAPLFKMPSAMRPSWVEVLGFSIIRPFVDTWELFPDRAKGKKVIGDASRGMLISRNPRRYRGKPRVGTMLELVRMSDDICARMHKFKAPFLALHGTADEITSLEGSQELYERAAATDRTLKTYEGACHSLVQGETDAVRAAVLRDIRDWLDARVK